MAFQYIIQGILMPLVSIFGIIGNSITIIVLKDKDVKLNKEFRDVLSGLATFDSLLLIFTFLLFSLPSLSRTYKEDYFPLTVPILYPATNIFSTASSYMTVAVGVNRFLDMSLEWQNLPRIKNGVLQNIIVFIVSIIINLPRCFEFEYRKSISFENITLSNGTTMNTSHINYEIGISELRSNENYVRDYTLITNSIVIVILPTTIMLISSCLIYKQMLSLMQAGILTNAQEHSRRRRNRNITIMLIGIVVLFLVCHLGEVVIAIYELTQSYIDGEKKPFPTWASNVVVVNHLLIVTNSSLNFVIYCKDIVFRQNVKEILRRKKQTLSRSQRRRDSMRAATPMSLTRVIRAEKKEQGVPIDKSAKESPVKAPISKKHEAHGSSTIIVKRIEGLEVTL